jgi:hypothetical protein
MKGVLFATRSMHANTTPEEPLLPDLPRRFYVDTCFLVNLVQTSGRPRGSDDDASEYERHLRAKTYWDEYVARRAKKPDEWQGIWSPIVLQEFYFVCAKNLMQLFQLPEHKLDQPGNVVAATSAPEALPRTAPPPKKKLPLPQLSLEARQALRAEIVNMVGTEVRQYEKEFTDSETPPPWFIKAVLPLIQKRLRHFFSHLVIVPDVCAFPHTDYTDLLNWGHLNPADCLTVLAARSHHAQAILTDDGQFADASAELAAFGISVLR